jgi:hypothetical protein
MWEVFEMKWSWTNQEYRTTEGNDVNSVSTVHASAEDHNQIFHSLSPEYFH